MSSRTFESGASKRRRKREQTNEIKKYHGSLNRYLFNSSKCSYKICTYSQNHIFSKLVGY